MNEETRRAGDAWRHNEIEREAMELNAREAVTFELPTHGPISWDTIERCAAEADMPIEDWVADAIAAHVALHTRYNDDAPQTERKPIPRWKARIAEWAYQLADWLTDDGSYHED